jgi:hypothetical protein
MQWVAEKDVKVADMSLGGYGEGRRRQRGRSDHCARVPLLSQLC